MREIDEWMLGAETEEAGPYAVGTDFETIRN